MRRSARGEQSAFSLFPFLAVLLCTMGAMVVLLVAIAHVARTKALREAELASVAAAQALAAADSPERREAEAKLAEAERFAEQLKALTEKGNERLKQEQERLSAIEDHLRRLRDESERLKTETAELFAVEEEHYDDEKIAREEIKRLNELIGQIEDEIEEAKHAAAGRERRFAVVPLRDNRSGTIRPPIYFECTKEGVTLQPEGIKLGWEDLVATKFSSPMAAASRAITRYYEEHPEARAANEAGPPYALLIVRPDGVEAYYGARRALETVGASYGYQPVGEDWPIEYDAPNPVLSQWVEEAIATARRERIGLARAIPELGREMSLAKLGPPSARGSSRTNFAGTGQGGSGLRVSRANPDATNPFDGLRIEGSLPGQSRGAANTKGGSDSTENVASSPAGNPTYRASGPSLGTASPFAESESAVEVEGIGKGGSVGGLAEQNTQANADNTDPETRQEQLSSKTAQLAMAAEAGQSQTRQSAKQGEAPEASAQAGGSGAGSSSQGSRATASAVVSAGSPGTAGRGGKGSNSQANRSNNSRSGVPMVRPIRLYVAADRVVVLPDRAQAPTAEMITASGPQSIRFEGPTTDRINEVIAALKRHADSWGIAGSDMYWDPRLVLNVTNDGAARADELSKLLEAAGLKVQAKPVATAAYPNTSGGTGATR